MMVPKNVLTIKAPTSVVPIRTRDRTRETSEWTLEWTKPTGVWANVGVHRDNPRGERFSPLFTAVNFFPPFSTALTAFTAFT